MTRLPLAHHCDFPAGIYQLVEICSNLAEESSNVFCEQSGGKIEISMPCRAESEPSWARTARTLPYAICKAEFCLQFARAQAIQIREGELEANRYQSMIYPNERRRAEMRMSGKAARRGRMPRQKSRKTQHLRKFGLHLSPPVGSKTCSDPMFRNGDHEQGRSLGAFHRKRSPAKWPGSLPSLIGAICPSVYRQRFRSWMHPT